MATDQNYSNDLNNLGVHDLINTTSIVMLHIA